MKDTHKYIKEVLGERTYVDWATWAEDRTQKNYQQILMEEDLIIYRMLQ